MAQNQENTAGSQSSASASLAKGLFLGAINDENLFPFPAIEGAESETLAMVLDSVERFMAGRAEDYRKFDREGAQPESYLQELRDLGLFGLIIPEEYGGIGLSNASYSRVLQQTSRYDASTSLTIGAHSSIGMKALLLYGTAAQKERYLPRLATGEWVASFCLTEPGSGSDAGSISTTATKQSDGSWILNGEKIWITNGAFADFFTVFAKTSSLDGKLSAFIVERGYTGVSTGPKEDKMGIRASATTTVNFNDVRVPAENLLGTEGHGFKIAMSVLNNGRTGLGGGCVGALKRCIELACQHATERKQFGRSISQFALVQEKIAQMTINCFAAESVVQYVAALIDRGHEDYSVEAAISKIFATEALWNGANEALQVAGGNGFMREFVYERIVRDSRINMIFEGTNEILRLYVALSGFKDAGTSLKEVGKSASAIFDDPIKGFGVLGSYAAKRLSQITPLGRDRLTVPAPLSEVAAVYEAYTARFGGAVEQLLRKYGRNLVGNQLISKRIAESAIDLTVGLAVLSRVATMVQGQGEEKSRDAIRIAQIFTQQAKRRIAINFRRLERNEDESFLSLARSILDQGRYPWDVIAKS